MTDIKAYKNELIVGIALLLLVIAFVYKQGKVTSVNDASSGATSSLQEFKEVIALKKVWADKKITKKVDSLQSIVSPSKVKWNKKAKKLTASFKNITASELNRLVVKIMNLAVNIQQLELRQVGASYHVEFKCKW